MLCVLCSILVAAPLLSRAQATAPNEKVPVMEGGAGPCSIELTVLGADGKPVYAATVKVYIKYGFGGIRRLDLEAGTNSDGKVRFAGLPARVQRPPLEFHGSKDEFTGIATFDPSTECQAKRQIALEKPKAQTAINGLSLNLLLWSLVFSTDSIPLKFHLKWQRMKTTLCAALLLLSANIVSAAETTTMPPSLDAIREELLRPRGAVKHPCSDLDS